MIINKKIYLAPMEGITGYVFRNAYNNVYGDIDKYFTPFIVPVIKREFKERELRDILPENNKGMSVVPQILSNNASDVLRTIEGLKKYGYDEININMGCPSGTVVSKKRGAGILKDIELLDSFLGELMENVHVKISLKTRIGFDSLNEYEDLFNIFNKYRFTEIIVHPRLREDYYKLPVHMDIFDEIYKTSKNDLCYNGDIFSVKDYFNIDEKYDNVKSVMLGRGVVAKPYLVSDIRNEVESRNVEDGAFLKIDYAKLMEFHNALFDGYRKEIQGDINVLYKMKEMWSYLSKSFDSEKLKKKLLKVTTLKEYEHIVLMIFDSVKERQ